MPDWHWTPDETGLDDEGAPLDGVQACPGHGVSRGRLCPFCGEDGCERSCTGAILHQQAADYPGVQARAARLYAAYVTGLGPLGTGLPPGGDLVERQQYAWRCVVRAGEGEA